ncbi:MAG: serine/threonine-protein kinase, partial [candidate division Zixibacteria bacterium]|nr:serine/threonine-protein kinase [candidate division Zixibacteria bacterium]
MEDEFLGSYRILKKAGAGGMSKVYLGVHQNVPNLKVILKILEDPRMGERFKQEADKLALLDGHPNICGIKDFFNHGDNTVIAMEYIDGITLEDKIKQEGKLSVGEALQITCKVLDVLGFAHREGIYHRDIKPGNIMIDKRGQVKIIDFGIAKGKTDPNLTIAGTACGTPAYMAPEQFSPSEDTDYALVDIYAIGTTLYMMLTGELPFKGDNPFLIRDTKLTSDPPLPRSINPDIKKTLEKIIMKSLARHTEDRYRSANEMRKALVAFHPGSEEDFQSVVAEVEDDSADAPITKQNKPIFIAVGVTVLAVIAFGLYWLLAPGGDDADLNTLAIVADTMSQVVDSMEIPAAVPTGTITVTARPAGDIYVG